MKKNDKAQFHLPGLFEFFEFYKVFLPIFRTRRDYFFDWVDIASIYGAPSDCIWGGGRLEYGESAPEEVAEFMDEFGISGRLTFSNSLLKEENLSDRRCNKLCKLFEKGEKQNGIIVYSDLLLEYLKENYPGFYFVSSTTKVITDFELLRNELRREDFDFVVPDFRFNGKMDLLNDLSVQEKSKVEFLCNECCDIGCSERKLCYENVSRKMLGEECPDHVCPSSGAEQGYLFSKAMKSPAFIGKGDIEKVYLPAGFSNFKIEGRGLGSALILEFLLYYLVKPDKQLEIREMVYLDNSLNLF